MHNLGKVSFISPVVYPWAQEFDERVVNGIVENNHLDIVRFLSWGSIARLAHPTYDHFLPLLVALGATHENDGVETFTR